MNENKFSDTTDPFSPQLLQLLREVGKVADSTDMHAYLVGGAVRDALLDRPIQDLDICIEGDALTFAETLQSKLDAEILMRSQFLTVRVKLAGTTIDISTCRNEFYTAPATLPVVHSSSLNDDLARRDFTINAMAFDISPTNWGSLIDPFNGRSDLQRHSIRSLHEFSFIDDPTRIFRAIRYSERLGFKIAPPTMNEIERNSSYIKNLSSDRIITELKKIYAESKVNDILSSANELGIMGKIHSALQWNDSHANGMNQTLAQNILPSDAFLVITGYLLKATDQIDELSERITNSSWSRELLRQAASIKSIEHLLIKPELAPTTLHSYLRNFGTHVLETTGAVTTNPSLVKVLQRELNEFRLTHPNLTANDLLEMGVPRGPAIGDILKTLTNTILNHPETTLEAETILVREWLQNNHSQE
jgi:tRNA nucleotidyltransferase (CCA-adding enzyme)